MLKPKYPLKLSIQFTFFIYTIIGFISLFVPMTKLFDESIPLINKIFRSALILFVVWLLIFIIIQIVIRFVTKIKVVDGLNGKGVYVVYGDLFNNRWINKNKGRSNICFAVNRCFDTNVSGKLVSPKSIHGMALMRLYDNKIYDENSLNGKIQQLIPNNTSYETLSRKDKPCGNLKRYEVGTSVNLPVNENRHYFMIGMTSYDKALSSCTSLEDYYLAIQRMIVFCDQHCKGTPTFMPVLGGGLSRLGFDEKTLLAYLISAFKFNIKHITSDFYIVVRKNAKISLFDLK